MTLPIRVNAGSWEQEVLDTGETSYETLLVSKETRLTTITFNRPDQRNAMSPQLHREMYHLLNDLKHDKANGNRQDPPRRDPIALQAVKEAWHYSLDASYDVAYELSGLISQRVKHLHGGRPGIKQFTEKKYRPGLGAYKWPK